MDPKNLFGPLIISSYLHPQTLLYMILVTFESMAKIIKTSQCYQQDEVNIS